MVVEHGDMAEINCNPCDGAIDTVPIDRAGASVDQDCRAGTSSRLGVRRNLSDSALRSGRKK
jgi:hypothetical protein